MHNYALNYNKKNYREKNFFYNKNINTVYLFFCCIF